MKRSRSVLLSLLLLGSTAIAAEKIPVVEVFDGPLEGSVVAKLLDRKTNVVCYVLAPSFAAYKQNYSSGKRDLVYDGNNVGSISCVKLDDRRQ